MTDGLLSLANLLGVVALLSWPADRCQDLVCPDQPVVEKVSPVVEKSLDFALTSLESCLNTTRTQCPASTAPSNRVLAFWDPYSFWLGFVAGILFLVVIYLGYRAFRLFVGSVLQSLAVQPAVVPQRQLALATEVVEPANRNTLRALGLAN